MGYDLVTILSSTISGLALAIRSPPLAKRRPSLAKRRPSGIVSVNLLSAQHGDYDLVSDGGGDQLTMKISKTQGYYVASRPVLLSLGLGLLTFSHAGVRRILAYT